LGLSLVQCTPCGSALWACQWCFCCGSVSPRPAQHVRWDFLLCSAPPAALLSEPASDVSAAARYPRPAQHVRWDFLTPAALLSEPKARSVKTTSDRFLRPIFDQNRRSFRRCLMTKQSVVEWFFNYLTLSFTLSAKTHHHQSIWLSPWHGNRPPTKGPPTSFRIIFLVLWMASLID